MKQPPHLMIEIRHDPEGGFAAVIHFETYEEMRAWIEWLMEQGAVSKADGDGRDLQ